MVLQPTATRTSGDGVMSGGSVASVSRAAMHARAALSTEADGVNGKFRSRVVRMRSHAPFALRPTALTFPDEPVVTAGAKSARVSLAAGAAGPVGGDQLVLDVVVGPGSTLVLSDVAARLMLPGPHGHRSRTTTRVSVAAGGTFVWLPKPAIAARGCNHLNEVFVSLEHDARLMLREEVILGRHGELPGDLTQHVRVEQEGTALYDQRLDFGPAAPGWSGPAVADANRALGSVLIVDPDWLTDPPNCHSLTGDTAVLPLAGPAALVTAVSPDSLALRRSLNAGLLALGHPWAPARRD